MPPQETNFSKKILTFSIGLTTGIILILGIIFALYKSNLLVGLFIDFTSPAVDYPLDSQVTVSPIDISNLSQRVIQKNNEQIVILVPKSMASKEYRDSLNDTVNHFSEMALMANQELIPALTEIGDNYKSKDFRSFFSNLAKIDEVNSRGYQIISKISDDIVKLKIANQSTSNAVAQSLTNTFIEKGEVMVDSANVVLETIDKMLSSNSFNPDIASEIKKADDIFNEKVKDFNEASQKLLEYIAKQVEATVTAQ